MRTHCRNGHELAGENLYIRPSDGMRVCRECRRSHSRTQAGRERRGMHPRETLTKVSNAPLRERFLELKLLGRINYTIIAEGMGWFYDKENTQVDTSRVKKRLGLEAYVSHGRETLTEKIDYDTAVKLSRLLGMDPYEAGV